MSARRLFARRHPTISARLAAHLREIEAAYDLVIEYEASKGVDAFDRRLDWLRDQANKVTRRIRELEERSAP